MLRGFVVFLALLAMHTSLRLRSLGRARRPMLAMCEFASLGGSGREIDTTHLQVPNSKIHPYWIERLARLRGMNKEATLQGLIKQLTPENNLGYVKPDGKTLAEKGSFFEYATLQRDVHPDKVILLRSGEFYETYGLDAVMLVALAGLNPMGGKCKAGCPVKNVQQTLDDLTDHGLSVAVYEEVAEPEMRPGPAPKTPKKKTRALTRIVTPASKTYPFELCLKSEDISYSPNRPYMGVMGSVSGYDLYEIRLDEQCVLHSSRLTEQGVEAFLRSSGFAEPVFTQRAKDLHPIISSLQGGAEHVELSGYSQEDFANIILRRVFAQNAIGEDESSKFRFVKHDVTGRPRCVYPMTQQQIGLSFNPNVPDLIKFLLPSNHAAHSARFWRKWLSIPPPHRTADHMQTLNSRLATIDVPLPSALVPYLVGKVVTLLNARQCNVGLLREVMDCSLGLQTMLVVDSASGSKYEPLISPLLALASYETGVVADRDQLLAGCKNVVGLIADVVQSEEEADPPSFSSSLQFSDALSPSLGNNNLASFPWEFFDTSEKTFRGRVRRDHPALEGLYDRVKAAAAQVLEAVVEEYPQRLKESGFTFDFHNNLVYLSSKPSSDESRPGVAYIHPVDRKGAVLTKRYTTHRVSDAVTAYNAVINEAPGKVEKVLQRLCEQLLTEQMTIIHVSNCAMIIQAANSHVVSALQKGWCLPKLASLDDSTSVLDLQGLSAYWMDRLDPSTKTNTLKLGGMYLLTAPNMSGKSTLMRSTLVAALLANAGLFVPCDRALVPRFDSFSMRTASYDVPIEGKSAFAMEIDDMRVILRDCTDSSLVMIDEIGKGTSSKEGSVLAAAILEELAARNAAGIFATHLHEIFDLPGLKLHNVELKKMETSLHIDASGDVCIDNRYTLEDGICTDSLALETARLVGGDALTSVCTRAAELAEFAEQRTSQSELNLLRAQVATLQQRLAEAGGVIDDALPVAAKSFGGANTRRAASTPSRLAENGESLSASTSDYDLDDVLHIIKAVTGTKDGALVLEGAFNPPASYEGSSCVYVLQCRQGSSAPFLYVGETESVGTRLAQHRGVTFRDAKIKALITRAPNKGSARLMETQLIRSFKALGYDVRGRDGEHRLFGGQRK